MTKVLSMSRARRRLSPNRTDHGQDVTLPQRLLATLEETQRLHVKHRDLIARELDEAITQEIRSLAALLTPAPRRPDGWPPTVGR